MPNDEILEAGKRRCIARILAVNDGCKDKEHRLAIRAIVMASVNSLIGEIKDATNDHQTNETS